LQNRTLWEHNYKTADGIVFVIDSADQDRIEEVKEEVHKILKDPELPEDAKVLFFANKQDVKGAYDTSELKQK
jgi:GTPase SAR1 family protein